MENHFTSPASPERASDSSESKDTKKSKKKYVPFVPIPLEVVQREADREAREIYLKDEKKKKKKEKKEADKPVLLEKKESTKDEDTAGDKKDKGTADTEHDEDKKSAETKEDDTADAAEESDVEPEAETTTELDEETGMEEAQDNGETEPKPKAVEYLGELPISPRARRQWQERQAAARAAAAKTAPVAVPVGAAKAAGDESIADRPVVEAVKAAMPIPEQASEKANAQDEEIEPIADDPPKPTTASGSSVPPPRPPRNRRSMASPPTPPTPPFPFGGGAPFGPENKPPAPLITREPGTPAVKRVEVASPRAERRNFLAGLIVGGLIEHVRHTRRERRQAAKNKKTTQTYTTTMEQKVTNAEQAQQTSARRLTTLETQLERLKSTSRKEQAIAPVAVPAEQTPTVRPEHASASVKNVHAENVPAVRPEAAVAPVAAEALPPAAGFAKAEATIHQLSEEEKQLREARKNLEQVLAAEREAAEKEEDDDVMKDRRVETSAWHRIEIDKRTGKAVENPTLAYGKEFENEQHQERLRREIEEADAITQALEDKRLPPVETTLPTPDMPTPGRPVRAAQKHAKASRQAKSSVLQNTSTIDVVLWMVLLLIIGAIFIALSA